MLSAAAGGPGPGGLERRGGRFSVLTWEQVQRLDQILGEAVPIHGRGNFPTLAVRPRRIVQVSGVAPCRPPTSGAPPAVEGEAWMTSPWP